MCFGLCLVPSEIGGQRLRFQAFAVILGRFSHDFLFVNCADLHGASFLKYRGLRLCLFSGKQSRLFCYKDIAILLSIRSITTIVPCICVNVWLYLGCEYGNNH